MPSDFTTSELRLYSLGIVVKDKLLDTNYIVVTPIEQLSSADGDLSTKDTIHTVNGTKVKKGNTILAEWIQGGQTNRQTSPNVYKNETVKIFRYADNDKYYWDTFKFESNIRRLEHVIYSYSNEPTPLVPYTATSSYYMTWSTLKQYIHLHTSTNNNEASGYDFKINTKTGIMNMLDTNNNQVIWNSVQKILTIEQFNQLVLNILQVVTATVGQNVNINVGQQVNVTVPTYTINGNFIINGNASINGNLKVSGTINAQGAISSATSVTAPNLT